MATVYTDTPHNFNEIEAYVITETKTFVEEIFQKSKCFFYDACSFRRHANLGSEEVTCILEYVKRQNGMLVLTRCILMELASHSGFLNQEYIQYVRTINSYGIDIFVIYEEDLFDVMNICFGTNAVINSYLSWAVRMIMSPVSTITDTLNQNRNLYDEIVRKNCVESSSLYRRFFSAVRGNKESGDNLGEELLAICSHILSYIPGEDDGKFCVITDDKGAAGKIDTLFRKTNIQFRGKKIGILSTPKLVQILYNENLLVDRECVVTMLQNGSNENIIVLGTRIYDLRGDEIAIGCEELADLIMTPNGIHITF